jgi:predicted transcriptional regulator
MFMSDSNTCPQHDVCLEKITQIQKDVDELDTRVDNVENRVLSIDRTLSDRLLILETTTKLGNESVNNNIEKLSKKVDRILEDKSEQSEKKESRTYEWWKWLVILVLSILIETVFYKAGFFIK